jgi:hypothetical protein
LQIKQLAVDFGTRDTAWGGEIHLSVLPFVLGRPVQVWRREESGIAPIYGEQPFGHDEFAEVCLPCLF